MEPELSDSAAVGSFTHDGATLVVEQTGAGDTAFLLVHGIGMGRSVFADAARHLAAHGRVIAVDLPGYGAAPDPPRTPSIERMADLVAAFLSAHVPGPRVLVGHSMGTQVVTEVAVRHPGLAAGVVLVAPTVDRRRRHVLPQALLLGLDLFGESPSVLLKGAREYVRAAPRLPRKLRAMIAHRPEESYPRVGVPALVLRGERDPVCPRRWCREVTAGLADGTFAELPGLGHETLIHDGRPAVARILAFAERLPELSAT